MIKSFVVGTLKMKKYCSSVKHVRKVGLKLHDVYTPYPVHGLIKLWG